MDGSYEKRMMMVFMLSMTLMIISLYFMPRSKVAQQTQNITNVVQSSSSSVGVVSSIQLVNEKGVNPTNVVIGYNGEMELTIDTLGGRIQEASINGKWNRKKEPVKLIVKDASFQTGDMDFGCIDNITNSERRLLYKIVEWKSNSVHLSGKIKYQNQMISVEKVYSLADNYQIIEEIRLKNISGNRVLIDISNTSLSIGASCSFFTRDQANSGNMLQMRYYDGKKLRNAFPGGFFDFFKQLFGAYKPVRSVILTNAVWISVNDNYFVSIVKPEDKNFSSRFIILSEKSLYKDVAYGIELPPFSLENGEEKSIRVHYYLGPKKEEILVGIDKSYGKFFSWPTLFYWFMKPIEWLMVKLMYVLSLFIPNWGIIIIFLAIIVKLFLSPLSISAAKSIKKSSLLQPKLKNLQEKYKDDPKTLNQKVAELYKSEGVNPLGGCLPLLMQIPVFFALLRVLSNSVELRGASFFWIQDLTQPDTLFKLILPYVGMFSFNLLPILMTVVQIIQTKLQSMKTVATTQQSPMNMYLLPLIFLFLFYNMPAGLVLYWTIQSLYSIAEQEVINLDKHVRLK